LARQLHASSEDTHLHIHHSLVSIIAVNVRWQLQVSSEDNHLHIHHILVSIIAANVNFFHHFWCYIPTWMPLSRQWCSPVYGQSITVGLETYFQVAVYIFKDWEHHKPLTNF